MEWNGIQLVRGLRQNEKFFNIEQKKKKDETKQPNSKKQKQKVENENWKEKDASTRFRWFEVSNERHPPFRSALDRGTEHPALGTTTNYNYNYQLQLSRPEQLFIWFDFFFFLIDPKKKKRKKLINK